MQILHCEYSEHGYDENEYEYEYASRRCSEVLEAKNAKTQAEIMSTRLANIYGYHVEKTWSELKLKTF